MWRFLHSKVNKCFWSSLEGGVSPYCGQDKADHEVKLEHMKGCERVAGLWGFMGLIGLE